MWFGDDAAASVVIRSPPPILNKFRSTPDRSPDSGRGRYGALGRDGRRNRRDYATFRGLGSLILDEGYLCSEEGWPSDFGDSWSEGDFRSRPRFAL